MKPSSLVRGPKGHPSHPPFTGATIGAYVSAAALGSASAAGVVPEQTAVAWWLTLLVGLLANVPAAVTGIADWLRLDRASELGRLGTAHFVAMGGATGAFLLAAVIGYDGYRREVVSATPLGLTFVGLGVLTLGGWLGGTMVFVHGARVVREPTDEG